MIKSIPVSWDYWTLAVLAGLMLAVAVIDFKWMIIPNILVVFGIVSGISLGLVSSRLTLWEMATGCVAGGGILLAVTIISRGGMGMGDVKLGAVMGIYLGWPNVLTAVFLAAFGGAAAGLLAVLFAGKTRHYRMPFGPFLALGTVVGYLWSMGSSPLFH